MSLTPEELAALAVLIRATYLGGGLPSDELKPEEKPALDYCVERGWMVQRRTSRTRDPKFRYQVTASGARRVLRGG